MMIGALAVPASTFASASKPVASVSTKVTISTSTPYVNSSTPISVTAQDQAATLNANGEVEQRNVIAKIGKKALSQILRYGGTGLGNLIKQIPYDWAQSADKSLSKWGNQAADMLDAVDDFVENSYALGLVQLGVPPADAYEIAKFIAFFL